MNEKEKEEILYRLDERTQRVDENLNQLDRRVKNNEKDIDTLETISDRNRRDISYGKAFLGFLSAVISTISAKLIGVFQI